MNRRELVLAFAERTETDRKTADAMITAFTELVTETVATGEPVQISGFCKFARVDRAARMGRNPQTGEPIKIKAKRLARITPLKAFKEAALSGKAPAKKAVAKKAPAKTTARKPAAKKAVAKKAPARTTARKPAVKRAPAKKTTAKRTTAKKTTARKTAGRR